MGYRLISPRDLYKEDIPNVVRPFVAKRILYDAFTFPQTIIFGMVNYVSPFGNKELQQKKLIQDIENGRVLLVAMSPEFGTIGNNNSSGDHINSFWSSIRLIKRTGKSRPTFGSFIEENAEFLAGTAVGFATTVGEALTDTAEFAADLAGSVAYDKFGIDSAKEAHERTIARIDNGINTASYIAKHPSESLDAALEGISNLADELADKLAQDNAFEVGVLAGGVLSEVVPSPAAILNKAKKLNKLSKIVTNKGPYNPHAWRKHLENVNPGKKITSTTVPPPSKSNVKLAGKRHPKSDIVFNERGLPIFDDVMTYETVVNTQNKSRTASMREATRQLNHDIRKKLVDKNIFTNEQLNDIKAGKSKIAQMTWHHNESHGKMQLIPEADHKRTGHIGGEGLKNGK